ncbi:MAG: hypothetical protein AAF840_10565 [Bacteroidota bacterium]
MSQRPDLLRPLQVILNFVLAVFVCCFIYLLFGESIQDSIRNQPQAMEMPSYKNGGASSNSDVTAEVRNGIHVPTGFVYAEGFDIVRGTCTACHSAKLVTQNRATREGWEEMIRWMQAKQGLWDLGKQEPVILDYLAEHYAPEEVGRRANLDVEEVEWYVLELEKAE